MMIFTLDTTLLGKSQNELALPRHGRDVEEIPMSPARSEKQRMAAGAELARRRKGMKARMFVGMSIEELRKLAHRPRRTRGT